MSFGFHGRVAIVTGAGAGHVLDNNAAILRHKTFAKMDLYKFEDIMRVNFRRLLGLEPNNERQGESPSWKEF